MIQKQSEYMCDFCGSRDNKMTQVCQMVYQQVDLSDEDTICCENRDTGWDICNGCWGILVMASEDINNPEMVQKDQQKGQIKE